MLAGSQSYNSGIDAIRFGTSLSEVLVPDFDYTLVEYELDQHEPGEYVPVAVTLRSAEIGTLSSGELTPNGAVPLDVPGVVGDFFGLRWTTVGGADLNQYVEFSESAEPGFAFDPSTVTYSIWHKLPGTQGPRSLRTV